MFTRKGTIPTPPSLTPDQRPPATFSAQYHPQPQQRFPSFLDRTVPHRTSPHCNATHRICTPSPSKQHAYDQVPELYWQDQGHQSVLRLSHCRHDGVLLHAAVHRCVGCSHACKRERGEARVARAVEGCAGQHRQYAGCQS